MPLDMTQLLRLKGTIDAVIAGNSGESASAAPALVSTYLRVRTGRHETT